MAQLCMDKFRKQKYEIATRRSCKLNVSLPQPPRSQLDEVYPAWRLEWLGADRRESYDLIIGGMRHSYQNNFRLSSDFVMNYHNVVRDHRLAELSSPQFISINHYYALIVDKN